jgi:hypothetical protein
MVLGAALLFEMPERAMKACVTRNLPEVWLDLMHIVESRSMAVSQDFGAVRTEAVRSPVLERRRYRSANHATETRPAASGDPDLADSPHPACYRAPIT